MPIFLSCVLLQDPFKTSLSGKVSSICSCYRKPPLAGWMRPVALASYTTPKWGAVVAKAAAGSPKWQVDRRQAVKPRQRWSKKSKLTKYLTCWRSECFVFFSHVCIYSTCFRFVVDVWQCLLSNWTICHMRGSKFPILWSHKKMLETNIYSLTIHPPRSWTYQILSSSLSEIRKSIERPNFRPFLGPLFLINNNLVRSQRRIPIKFRWGFEKNHRTNYPPWN